MATPPQALSPIRVSKAPISPATPVTPGSRVALAPVTPSPGRWRHPRWTEIAQRQKAGVFDQNNLNRVAMNVVLVCVIAKRDALSILVPPLVMDYLLQPLRSLVAFLTPNWLDQLVSVGNLGTSFLLVLLALFNIASALRPLHSAPDQISNIDLNAQQRKLLGLDPNATPPTTSNTKYVTPPRYKVSPSPRSASASGNRGEGEAGGSPAGSSFGSSFGAASTPSRSPLHRSVSASAAYQGQQQQADWKSPTLLRQAAERKKLQAQQRAAEEAMQQRLGESFAFGRRNSGSGSGGTFTPAGTPPSGGSYRLPLDGTPSGGGGSIFAPNTPSPAGRQASVSLNSRWLYERARRSSSGASTNLI